MLCQAPEFDSCSAAIGGENRAGIFVLLAKRAGSSCTRGYDL
jgi:hypothetical protein